MCGISAILSTQKVTTANLYLFNNIIHHRGPDDEGYLTWSSKEGITLYGGDDTPAEVYKNGSLSGNIKNYSCEFSFGMAQRRLSIIDTSSAGHNPMSYHNGRYWIVYNGEVYNYRELRLELEQKGCTFSSQTDTEVILAAYSVWGIDCLHRFVGMWAFVIFDASTQTMFAARDRYGIKPLYYWVSEYGDLFFASEIKQFTTLPNWTSRPNYRQVSDFTIHSATDHNTETMFAGVYHIPPGAYFTTEMRQEFTNGKKISHTQWYFPPRQKFEGSFDDAVKQFRECFLNSVQIHLRADVPIGTALSGGLDSSSIAGVINAMLRSDGRTELQNTFSSCSKYPEFDERPWMDQVVDFLGVNAHFVYPDARDIFGEYSRLIWYQDEPYSSQSAFLANNVFNTARQKGIKVLLNGQGSDEYIGGYGQFSMPYFSELLCSGQWGELSKALPVYDNRGGRASLGQVIRYASYYSLPQSMRRSLSSRFGVSSPITALIDTSRIGGIFHPYDNIPFSLKNVEGTANHFLFHSSLPKYLRWEDRNSMSHSIEARVPFLDHRLVEFTQSLPFTYLQKNGIRKAIQREALAEYMPINVKNRPDKMGYETPEKKWVTQEIPDLFLAKMSDAVEVTNGFVQPAAIDYLKLVIAGKVRFDYSYWKLIMLGEWAQQFNVKF